MTDEVQQERRESLVDHKQTVERFICHAITDEGFADIDPDTFSLESKVDVFDVVNGVGLLTRAVGDKAMQEMLKEDQKRQQPRSRFILLDGMLDEPSKVPITASLLRTIFRTYRVNDRFADFISRQRMPGRGEFKDEEDNSLLRHEIWYSAVIRSMQPFTGKLNKLSRQVMNWQRFCIWSDCHSNGNMTYLVLRCPIDVKEKFYSCFRGGRAANLSQHPMLFHAFMAERLLTSAYDFLKNFSGPLYDEENKLEVHGTAREYTDRSKAFLALTRRIQQVATDYDILEETMLHLRDECKWLGETDLVPKLEEIFPDRVQSGQNPLDDTFKALVKDVRLIETYSGLYVSRSQIGVSECFANVTHREAELSSVMAVESTAIARASHQDNRSLRTIQYMTVLFLPASFISGIFGMGFFSTNQDVHGHAVLLISGKWWWYFAAAVPLTLVVLMTFGLFKLQARRQNGGPQSNEDLEAQLEEKIK